MAVKKKKSDDNNKLIAQNRRARFEFEIEDTFEAGISLVGTEVKALREGKANIAEGYVGVENGEIMLINANIPLYAPASQFNHLPTRPRKLLLKKREIAKLIIEQQRKGRTIVPLKMYFNDKGFVKLLVGVGIGKSHSDKRDNVKTREWNRQKARIMREQG
ncbi:SsrA-binding protein SmpB [Robiginitomaculum antarcticum]|uniref:SsrA-binding protein SmpB n=1 Tax=Robiginitomaculum antarcticum TaxID=437507 RepID=UPI0003798365|nr:SsrA-binding protein SmpB [Robiginitomaculum antarcticum]